MDVQKISSTTVGYRAWRMSGILVIKYTIKALPGCHYQGKPKITRIVTFELMPSVLLSMLSTLCGETRHIQQIKTAVIKRERQFQFASVMSPDI